MLRLSRIYPAVYLATALLLWAPLAMAQIELRWSPGDTAAIAPLATNRLAIHIDDSINFRTIEITVHFDTTVVKSLGGGSGSLYSESGYFVFDGFEEEPGSWHGFAIIMGAEEYLTGPGELLFWDFEGLTDGICPVVSVETLLYDEASPPNLIPNIILHEATIIVGDPLSSVGDNPLPSIPLRLAPNPFNPRTRISFKVERETPACLTVFDLRGHQIVNLFQGTVPEGSLSVDWDGLDGTGRKQPDGVYLFQLITKSKITWAKGLMLK